MDWLYTSGRIVDIVLSVIALEIVVLTLYYARTGRGIAPNHLVPNLLSAVFLLLALRSVLTGADWKWMAAFLAASFPAHLLDLRRRWNKARGSSRHGPETGIAPGRGDR